MSGCFALTSVPLSGDDPDDPAGEVRLDLVEQLHRLDEPDDLADRHLAADRDVGRRAGRRRGVEDAGERCLDRRLRGDGRLAAGRRRLTGRRGRSPVAAAPATGRHARRRRSARAPTGLRRTRPVPPASTSSSVRSDRSSSAASRSMRPSSSMSPSSVGGTTASATAAGSASSRPRIVRRERSPGWTSSVMRPTGGRAARCSARRSRTSSRARRGRRARRAASWRASRPSPPGRGRSG